MVQKVIYVEPLQKRFVVELKDANKEKRNRSYSNASDCCGAKLKQEKKCSNCEKDVAASACQRKLVKVGKEEHLIDASLLEQVMEQLEQVEEVTVHTILNSEPQEFEDRYDALVYALPVEKKSKEYAELRDVLKGKVAVGKGVFRSNEFQVVVKVGDDGVLRVRKLVEESQRYPVEVSLAQQCTAISPEIVELERKILEKKAVDTFDVKAFKDSRAAMEEQIIEDVVLNGVVPTIKPLVQEQAAQDEVERLKILLGV